MKNALLAAVLTVGAMSAADAATLLTVDLSTTNQITIASTAGASAATVSGSDTIGVYLAGIYASVAPVIADALVAGNLTSALNTSDDSPQLFTSSGNPGTGLNIFGYTADPQSEFVAGQQAFSGSATWTISSTDYALLSAGASSGDLFFPADDDTDIAGATLIGEWERIDTAAVPLPAAAWLLGAALLGLGAVSRRRG